MTDYLQQLLALEHKKIGSTQTEAKRLLSTISTPYVIIAEEQTAGRGRTGNKWVSPAKKNSLFSLVVQVPKERKQELSILSPLVSIAIQEQLVRWKIENIRIKWPNDILVFDKKICGLLIEIIHLDQNPYAIIGVGLNINLTQEECSHFLEKPITSLFVETKTVWDIQKTTYNLIEAIFCALSSQETADTILNKWIEKCSWMIESEIKTHRSNGAPIHGTVLGFTKDGALRIYNKETQTEETIYSL